MERIETQTPIHNPLALEPWRGIARGTVSVQGETSPLVVVGKDVFRELRSLNLPQELQEVPSIAEAVEFANTSRPDALLLDVGDDAQTASAQCAHLQYRPAIVFVSNNPLFAHHAFEMGAVDCMAKPLEPARLARALERMQVWCRAQQGATTAIKTSTSGDLVASRWLRMVRNGSLLVAPIDEVVYFQAERKLTRVVLEKTDGYLHMGINAVSAKLDGQVFWRLHRSTIVNGRFVSVVQRDELGRLGVRVHGRTEILYVSKAHDALWRDGIF